MSFAYLGSMPPPSPIVCTGYRGYTSESHQQLIMNGTYSVQRRKVNSPSCQKELFEMLQRDISPWILQCTSGQQALFTLKAALFPTILLREWLPQQSRGSHQALPLLPPMQSNAESCQLYLLWIHPLLSIITKTILVLKSPLILPISTTP